MTTDEMESQLASWHARRFGGPVDVPRTLAKVFEEVGELARGWLKGDTANMREEAADVAITLSHLVRGLGGNLFECMRLKMIVLEARLSARQKEANRDH